MSTIVENINVPTSTKIVQQTQVNPMQHGISFENGTILTYGHVNFHVTFKNGVLVINGYEDLRVLELKNFAEELAVFLETSTSVKRVILSNFNIELIMNGILYKNKFNDILKSLLKARHLASLELHNCLINEESLALLTSIILSNPELQEISISDPFCGNTKIKEALFDAIFKLNNIVDLRLVAELYSDSIIEKFRQFFQHTTSLKQFTLIVADYYLRRRGVSPADVNTFRKIYDGLRLNSSIFSIGFSGSCGYIGYSNQMEADNKDKIQLLANFMRHRHNIRLLTINDLHLNDDSFAELASVFISTKEYKANTSLAYLKIDNVSSIEGKCDGIRTLLMSLKTHPSLKYLEYSYTTDKLVPKQLFADLLTSPILKLSTLNLCGSEKKCSNELENSIVQSGIKALTLALMFNRYLTSLDISHCFLGDTNILTFTDVIKANRSLTSLKLHDNNVSASTIIEITAALTCNKSITELTIHDTINNFGQSLARTKIDNSQQQSLVGIEAILRRNKKVRATVDLNICRAAILIAFVRANQDNDLRYSVLPLIPFITKSTF